MPLRHPVCGRITYPLGLNPAGVSLCRMHAAQSPLRTDCGTFWHALLRFGTQSADELPTPWAWILLGFPCFACMPHRALCGPIVAHFGTLCFAFSGFEDAASAPSLRTNYLPLGLESCWGSLFRMHAAQSPLRTDCGTFWHAFAFAFSGFEDAASAPSLRTNYLPLGLESCWGFPVSHACRTEPFADRLWHILARFALLLAVSKMPLRHPVCGRITYPLGLNPAGVPCFACMPHRALCGPIVAHFGTLLLCF